jgi:hypothetical protein
MCDRRLAAALLGRIEDLEVTHVLDLPGGEVLTDEAVFEHAAENGWAILTRDIPDFLALHRRWRSEARDCPPLILLTPRYDPHHGHSTVGAIVTDIAPLLGAAPGPNAVLFLHPNAR